MLGESVYELEERPFGDRKPQCVQGLRTIPLHWHRQYLTLDYLCDAQLNGVIELPSMRRTAYHVA